jgi:MFS transporter, ACS family, glucarate transporter
VHPHTRDDEGSGVNEPDSAGRSASRIRYGVIAVACLSAVLLYLDRFCWVFAQRYVKEDLGLSDKQLGWCMSGFFLTYALAQVPSGWLADRFGPRRMMTLYILIWSFFTGAMGLVGSFLGLLFVRLATGIGQAGAYPTCASVVRTWMPFSARGMASSVIAFGGRVGGGIAPVLTAWLVIWFVPLQAPVRLTEADILMIPKTPEQTEQVVAPAETLRRELAETLITRMELAPGALDAIRAEERSDLAERFNRLIEGPVLFDPERLRSLPLEREAKRLLGQDELGPDETQRLNRLVLEAVFPDTVRKIYVQGWRSVMIFYGLLGIPVALLFWWIVRDSPRGHPLVNEGELEKIGTVAAPVNVRSDDSPKEGFPLVPILTSRTLWLLSVCQFGTNIGWAFLVTWLPRYLLEVHRVPFEMRGLMVTVALWCGWFGMLGGGWLTDRLTRRFGVRWGRALPIGGTRLMAGACFVVMLLHPDPWVATALFALVAFSTDAGAGATWAFNQDVGGRYTASVLGWGNMWGNIGAACSPLLIDRLVETYGNWDMAFVACAAAFGIAGICGLLIDARRKIAE